MSGNQPRLSARLPKITGSAPLPAEPAPGPEAAGGAEGLCPPPAFCAPRSNPPPEVQGEAGCGSAATLPGSAAWGSSADDCLY